MNRGTNGLQTPARAILIAPLTPLVDHSVLPLAMAIATRAVYPKDIIFVYNANDCIKWSLTRAVACRVSVERCFYMLKA